MATYLIRRLLLMIPTLLGITMVVFFIMAWSPGGIGGPMLTEQGNIKGQDAQRIREYYEKRYGLNKPAYIQYLRWLNEISPLGFHLHEDGRLGSFGFKRPSLGESLMRHQPVSTLLAQALPVTLLLNLISIPIVYGIGIISGLMAARRRGGWFDVGSGATFLTLWSVPSIWAGVLMIGLLANKQYFDFFPTAGLHSLWASDMTFLPHHLAGSRGWDPGWLLDTLWHLILPIACLSYGGFAFLAKLTRGSVLDNISSDYIRTARAKGLSEHVVLYRHVFRNSLLSLITVASAILPSLLAGSVVVETVFSIPGMGELGLEAVLAHDRELVLAVTLIAGMIGLLSTILRDVCYAIADPRVGYE